MDGWDNLKQQLDCFAEKGLVASFWWRDDDACELTPALDRLVTLACNTDTPLAIAVIPDSLSPSLPERLASTDRQVKVLQHGFSHQNHAAEGQKKQELTTISGPDLLYSRLIEGRVRLAEAFGDTFVPVLVPPWNRIDEEIREALPSLGFLGLSTFGHEGEGRWKGEILRQVNCHLDIFQWKPERAFRGAEKILHDLASQLARRADELNTGLIGLMTHHLYHDEEAWEFLQCLITYLHNHPGIRFCEVEEVFQLRDARLATCETMRAS